MKNLLSQGIVDELGAPGPNFAKAAQFQANDAAQYSIAPNKTGAYATLPPPDTGRAHTAASDTNPPPFATVAVAGAVDHDLLQRDLRLLTTGATGLPPGIIDTRIENADTLPNGPFQITPGVPYDAYTADPVHRFYQAWQQSDCDASHAGAADPAGCLRDLFPWVEVTVGTGSSGQPQPAGFNDQSTGEGSISMGFYNVLQGDMPFFKRLADRFTISDNYHQPAQGGTGIDSILAGFGDDIWHTDGNGNPTPPPANQIENPDPQAGTNNFYTQDGFSGGAYSACADTAQPGVPSVVNYLQALKPRIAPNCEPSHFYLLNNLNPGFFGDGSVNTTDPLTIPPVSTHSIGDVLLAANVSFHWYGEGWNQFKANPTDPTNVYCNICNPFLYQSTIMTNAAVRDVVNKDTQDFANDLAAGNLPSISFVKPGALNDGHPTSSKFSLFEGFVRKIYVELRAHPDLWRSTAVLITTDEGGAFYDSGYVQPLDFFGDGPRIPLIVVSPFSRGGHVAHSYSDHVSILKFVEANWKLGKISGRSRDNLPNPTASTSYPYIPTNSPAIGNLMDAFHFDHGDDGNDDSGDD